MALTAQGLAAELGVTQDRATALLAAVTALVERYAPDAPVQLVTFRVTALARVTAPPVVGAAGTGGDLRAAERGRRRVHFAELGGFVDCPIYAREGLPRGSDLEGPAILEQMDSTTVVLPGQVARSDEQGNLNLTVVSAPHDAGSGGSGGLA